MIRAAGAALIVYNGLLAIVFGIGAASNIFRLMSVPVEKDFSNQGILPIDNMQLVSYNCNIPG